MTTPDAGQAKPSSQNTRLIEDKDRQRLIDWFQSSADCWTNDKEFSEVIAMLRADAAEIERLRGVEADARRYRALRDCPQHACIWPTVFMANDEAEPTTGDPLFGETLDKAADAAIAASRSTGAADVGEDQ